MSNQLTQNFDWSKIFVWDNRYQDEKLTNSGYDDRTAPAGMVMARLQGTTEIVPFESSNPKANVPLGVLADNYDIAAGDTENVTICIAGDVVANKLIFAQATDNLDTIIGSPTPGLLQTVRDYLQSNNTGIKLVNSTELTSEDNQ